MKAVFILGSESDMDFASKITKHLDNLAIEHILHIASAHKQPLKVMEVIDTYAKESSIIFVTIAGRSNALSGFVAANSTKPVIACPPFKDNLDMLVNIQSTLQMPSKVPVMTVLDPENCALAIKRILDFL